VIADELILEKGVSAGDSWVTVEAARIREALAALKAEGFRLLVFETCVDHLVDASRAWPGRYELVYQLRNMETLEHLRVRALIDGDPPRCQHLQHQRALALGHRHDLQCHFRHHRERAP